MPHIRCPTCDKTIDISNVKFTINERKYLDDEIYESLRENVQCPHCKGYITLDVEAQIDTHIWVGKKTDWAPSQQKIEWGSGHEPAIEYSDSERRKK